MESEVLTLKLKKVVYFVARSENVPHVLQEALFRSPTQNVTIFFDLDGARALDEHYARLISQEKKINLFQLLQQARDAGIEMFVCQMNVMESCQIHCLDGIASAGVVTFLEYSYEADAIFSY
ncbi:DsrE/DsrF/DrsH-like family protein [Alicyclobacillus tolerans]|uniref:DsrE/DsrF/DrsH-like family protein n=1 Tax=Alicyclobacillus tolerans TaxID=90970 RepID=A0A1M6N6K4_9BACL|nr:DsrE/DsrF/DrsH-like family protein [Alicyclobacillus montanus]SHJ91365.1 DsrE/DsrF/DrsH-like family protein [Alicyclobacillus montanus]